MLQTGRKPENNTILRQTYPKHVFSATMLKVGYFGHTRKNALFMWEETQTSPNCKHTKTCFP